MSYEALKDKWVLVTGGRGFIGRHLVDFLRPLCRDVFVADRRYNLCHLRQAEQMFEDYDCYVRGDYPDYVFHLAGVGGNIRRNRERPASVFWRTTTMTLNLLVACTHRTRKVVCPVASCAYGEVDCPEVGYPRPLPEDAFFGGTPHPSVAPHGQAKRAVQSACSFWRREHGLVAVCPCPTTVYGPGHSPSADYRKVLDDLVRRFVDAADSGEKVVRCWGTGSPLREFLYVKDCARLLVDTLLHYDDSDLPLNLGTGQELSVKDLAALVAEEAGFTGETVWDQSQPNGQFRKALDLTRMKQTLPPFEPTPLREGIRQTVRWYREVKQ